MHGDDWPDTLARHSGVKWDPMALQPLPCPLVGDSGAEESQRAPQQGVWFVHCRHWGQ